MGVDIDTHRLQLSDRLDSVMPHGLADVLIAVTLNRMRRVGFVCLLNACLLIQDLARGSAVPSLGHERDGAGDDYEGLLDS